MSKKPTEAQILKDVRRAYILAKALNIQYQFIREYVNTELYKSVSNAKGTNAYFIKQIDQAFGKRYSPLNQEEEMAFRLLDLIEEEEITDLTNPQLTKQKENND